VEVAVELKRLGIEGIVFWIFGRDGIVGASEDMRNNSVREGVEKYFLFFGLVADPEYAIASCDVVINLTRDNNAWGRDTIEAMVYGRPVISIGAYDKFITHEETGILLGKYSAHAVAEELVRLKEDAEFRQRLGRNAEARAKEIFDGRTQARIIEDVYEMIGGEMECDIERTVYSI
jgi:glycosyltransferase involved in cell wall biosynthesis